MPEYPVIARFRDKTTRQKLPKRPCLECEKVNNSQLFHLLYIVILYMYYSGTILQVTLVYQVMHLQVANTDHYASSIRMKTTPYGKQIFQSSYNYNVAYFLCIKIDKLKEREGLETDVEQGKYPCCIIGDPTCSSYTLWYGSRTKRLC